MPLRFEWDGNPCPAGLLARIAVANGQEYEDFVVGGLLRLDMTANISKIRTSRTSVELASANAAPTGLVASGGKRRVVFRCLMCFSDLSIVLRALWLRKAVAGQPMLAKGGVFSPIGLASDERA